MHREAGRWFDDAEIYRWFGENLNRVREPSLRHYVRARELKAAGMDWTAVLATEDENKCAGLPLRFWRVPSTAAPRRGSRRSSRRAAGAGRPYSTTGGGSKAGERPRKADRFRFIVGRTFSDQRSGRQRTGSWMRRNQPSWCRARCERSCCRSWSAEPRRRSRLKPEASTFLSPRSSNAGSRGDRRRTPSGLTARTSWTSSSSSGSAGPTNRPGSSRSPSPKSKPSAIRWSLSPRPPRPSTAGSRACPHSTSTFRGWPPSSGCYFVPGP